MPVKQHLDFKLLQIFTQKNLTSVMANLARIHRQPSSSLLHSKRLEDIVKQRCKSKNPIGINEALNLFHQMLDEMPKPQIFSFNLLLTSISRMKDTHHHHLPAITSLYNKINSVRGISPDVITFGIFINCFCRMNRVDLGFAIFGSLLKRGWSGNVSILNSLINGLCKQNKVGEAAQLLDRMPKLGFTPDVFLYTTLIKGLCNTGNTSSACELLQKMSEVGCKPDVITYTTIISALLKGGTLDIAFKLFEEMTATGIAPDVITYNTLIDALCKEGAMDKASKLLDEMTAT